MKIKLDENIPGAVADFLRSRDHDVQRVLEESLGGRDDPTVLRAATSEVRLLITLDRGFGDVRAYPPGTHPGIIVMRPDDQRVSTVVDMVKTLVDHHDIDGLAGCITVLQRNVLHRSIERPIAIADRGVPSRDCGR